MQLLVDVSAGLAIAEVLRTLGHDVVSVRDRNARTAEKERVILEIFRHYADQLPGRFAVYQDGRLRIR